MRGTMTVPCTSTVDCDTPTPLKRVGSLPQHLPRGSPVGRCWGIFVSGAGSSPAGFWLPSDWRQRCGDDLTSVTAIIRCPAAARPWQHRCAPSVAGRWGSTADHEREAGGHQRPKSQNRYGSDKSPRCQDRGPGRVAECWRSWSNRRPRDCLRRLAGGRQWTGNTQPDCPKPLPRTAACWCTTPSSGLRAGKGGEVPGIGSSRRTIRWRRATAALRPNWVSITASGPPDRAFCTLR
jgi:hypothetical protein